MKTALIRSAVILGLFSLMVYFTTSAPDASVWTAMGTILMAAIRTIQWLIGMTIALTVSIAVLIGIFFGAVALSDSAAASRMYEGLRQTLLDKLMPAACKAAGLEQDQDIALTAFGDKLKTEIMADMKNGHAIIKQSQADLAAKLTILTTRLTEIEETTAGQADAEQVTALADEVKESSQSLAGLTETITNLQSSVTGMTTQEVPEPAASVDLTSLEEAVSELKAELSSVKESIVVQPEATESTPVNTPEKSEEEAGEEHRILSYFDEAADKEKVAAAVQSTLKKDMSYKQVINLVAEQLGGAKGEIISSHPTLIKEYIRYCRQK